MSYLFYSFINFDDRFDVKINNLERQNYVNTIKNERRRAQSVAVWKLLEYASKRLFGGIFDYFESNGAWFVKNSNFKFSLAHSNNLVAVLIDENDVVGVDCELVSNKLLKLEKFFSTNAIGFSNISQNLKFIAKQWTKKESLIKANKNLKGQYRFVKNGSEEYCIYGSSASPIKFVKINFTNIIKETI